MIVTANNKLKTGFIVDSLHRWDFKTANFLFC